MEICTTSTSRKKLSLEILNVKTADTCIFGL